MTSQANGKGVGSPQRRQSKTRPQPAALTASQPTLKRELSSRRAEDQRVGNELNEMLRNPENRRDPEKLLNLWAEIKERLMRRYGSIRQAFRALDVSGDGSIGFIEFNDMLRQIHIPLDQRVCRAIFEKVAGNDRQLSLEELNARMAEKTISKFNRLLHNFNIKQDRVQEHIQTFLQGIMNADETNSIRGIDRFQRKITVPFCQEIWLALLGRLGKSRAQEATVDRALYQQVVQSLVGKRLLAHEAAHMMRIFDRADPHRQGNLSLMRLITTLLLLTAEPENQRKIRLLFEMHDADYDGCLEYHEILAMFRCICAQRPIAEESSRGAYDLAFQDELSSQEGLRAYERARWYLQRSIRVEGGIVSAEELQRALDQQPEILEDLMPGTVRIRWLLEPAPEAARESREASRAARRQLQAARQRPEPPAQQRNLLPGPVSGLLAGARTPTPNFEASTESGKFKKTVTWKFQRSLRTWGDVRLAELIMGELPPNVQGGDECDSNAGSDFAAGAHHGRASPKGRSAPGLLRVNSSPAALTKAPASPLSSPHGAKFPHRFGDLPPIDKSLVPPDKWGPESADRFRLFCTVKNSFGSRCEGGHNPIAVGNIEYECHLCRRPHLLNPLPD